MHIHCNQMMRFKENWFNFALSNGQFYQNAIPNVPFEISDLMNRHVISPRPAIIFFEEGALLVGCYFTNKKFKDF